MIMRPLSLLRSAHVLYRRKLIRPTRPYEMLRSLLLVRQLGPFAGATRIAARRDPDRLGLVDDLGALTFHQLDLRSNALARAWLEDGLSSRDVIGVLCRNHRGFLDAMLASAKIGARAVLLNTGFAGRQLADVAARERITVLVHDQEFAPLTWSLSQRVSRYLSWITVPAAVDAISLERLIIHGDDAPLPAPPAASEMVLLTSGTSGTPKGAPRRVRSAFASAEFLHRLPYRRNEATLIAAPVFHGIGMSQFVMTLVLASTTVLCRRFDPTAVLAGIQRHRCTGVVLVPTMLLRILDLGENMLSRYDTSSLRIILTSGSALSPELGNRAVRAFGPVIYNLYGSTEVAVATIATPRDWRRAPGTVGKSPVGCRVRLLDPHGAPVTRPYERGRVYVTSGLKFGGYTSGDTKEEIGGLMATGDVGHLDKRGLLFIDGRADDMIISGGENVYPGEVENLLVEHPGVNDAAVVGVPDRDYGQRLKAYVVLEPGAMLHPDELNAFVRQHLARYKVPRDVVYVAELPRNQTGKLLRRALT
ncbi:MAG: AMP-binding protein [Micromonosporaceae bacterium]|nr:AMP-binding protein [Micromonosporaceae bacterium]